MAAFDTTAIHVYVAPMVAYNSHSYLVELYDLPNTHQDSMLDGSVLYGFITASGHYLNRGESLKWVRAKFPELLKSSVKEDKTNLIASDIDWYSVITKTCQWPYLKLSTPQG